jgi:hypothetical protein
MEVPCLCDSSPNYNSGTLSCFPMVAIPVKKLPTKADLRAEIAASIDDFIAQGGEVRDVPRGQSAWQPGEGRQPGQYADRPRQTQTFVPDIIAAIEARRRPQVPAKEKPKKPEKRLVLDDFGEPLRWEWVEQ